MPFEPECTYDADSRIWSGKDDPDYFAPHLSIGEIIFNEMRRHPHLIAQISDTENTVLTRAELHMNSMRVASYMRALGMLQSDIVGIIARNTTHIFSVVYGCFFNGIAIHTLNPGYEQETIEKLFTITKPRLIFCDGEDYEKVKSATENLNVKIITMRNHHPDAIRMDDVLATPVEENFEPSRLEHGNDQTLAILCSSGTTGMPKAVTISNKRQILFATPYLTTADVQYTHSTLDWITGLLATISSAVYSTKRVIADNPFDPARLLRVIEEYKVTWLMQAPSHMAIMAFSPTFVESNLDSLNYYLYGGGRCPIDVQHRIRNRLRSDCLHYAYGFTEIGSIVSLNWNFDEKPNSVGRICGNAKLKVVNDLGEPLEPNQVGEVLVYTEKHWAGYYGNPEESNKMRDKNLWFHSGDLGYIDEDGFLYIVERKKDMLKYQNIMYYPHEIEEVISKMPGVAEVCVFGIWNQFNGDHAAASVVKKSGSNITAEDVVEFVRENIKATYKQLHGGALIVDELKLSPNGKASRLDTKTHFLQIKNEK